MSEARPHIDVGYQVGILTVTGRTDKRKSGYNGVYLNRRNGQMDGADHLQGQDLLSWQLQRHTGRCQSPQARRGNVRRFSRVVLQRICCQDSG